jgi:hypothetical protein
VKSSRYLNNIIEQDHRAIKRRCDPMMGFKSSTGLTNELDELIERSARTDYGRSNDRRYFVLYAKTGFTPALQRRAATQPWIALHTPQTMLRSSRTRVRSPKRQARVHR